MSYTDEELEDCLRRAFVDKRYPSIDIWSRRETFQLASLALGEKKGWLTSRLIEIDEQSSKINAWLTEAGKKHFGLE
jgi:hypothetical protein